MFLGRISYSFYLFNVLFLQMLTPELFRHASPGRHPLEFGLGLAAVVIVLTIPVAVLSERFLERPSIELGRRFSSLVPPTIRPLGWRGGRGCALRRHPPEHRLIRPPTWSALETAATSLHGERSKTVWVRIPESTMSPQIERARLGIGLRRSLKGHISGTSFQSHRAAWLRR